MARYSSRGFYSCDQNGAIIQSATVTVFLAGTTTPASFYTASTGGVAVTSTTSDATTGYFQIWIDDAVYSYGQNFDIYVNKTVGNVAFTPSVVYDEAIIPNPNVDTDPYLTANSDGKIPSQKAVRTAIRYIDPGSYGAKGDGTTDDAAAFTAAFAAITAAALSSTGEGSLYTVPKFRTNAKKYRIASTVTLPVALIWEGADSQIIIDNSVKAFVTPNGVSSLRIDGVQFWGGATAIEYDPTTGDFRMIEIENCAFETQTAYGLKTTSTSTVNGFNLRVRKSKFLNTSGNTTYVPIQNMSDMGLVEDCWFENYAAYQIQNYGNLVLRGNTNVTMTTGQTLIKNYGTSLYLGENRLGNDNGGAVIVENHTSGIWNYSSVQTCIIIEKNFVYESAVPLIKFYALPNQVTIRENSGVNYLSGLYFDATIPANDVKNFSSTNYCNYENVTPILILTGDSTKYGAFLAGDPAKTISTASLIATLYPGDGGNTFAATLYSSAGYTDLLGRTGYAITSTGAGSTSNYIWAAGLSSCTSGRQYTVSLSIDVIDSQILDVSIVASKQIKVVSLGMGHHQINFPIRYDSGDSSLAVYINNFTGSYAFTSVRVLAGDIAPSTQDFVFLGAALPVAGIWLIGDRILNVPPVAGQPKGWRCTVTGDYAGSAPTWVAEGKLGVGDPQTGTASPSGSVTPGYIGQTYVDTTNHKVYVSEGLANTNWLAVN
jgi:hypothetical protein